MMSEEELRAYEQVKEEERECRLIEIWTAKEAIFKSKGIAHFIPKEQDTRSAGVHTESIIIDGKKYIWSVATATPEKVRVFSDIDLSK
jgi:phosphopantetheinyl transferase